MQNFLADSGVMTRVAAADQPPPEAEVVPAKAESKVVEARPVHVKSAVAKTPSPQRHVGAQDEANCPSIEACASVLKAMVSGADRSWIGRPAAPTALANGVRLFAYRALKPKLTCGELASAQSEVETAARAFGGSIGDLSPEKVMRTRSLCVAVGGELRAERARRCSQPGKEGPVG